MAISDVSVEKLILARLAENSSRQDALQAIFSGWVDIFYHRIRGRFRRKRVFQQPRLFSPMQRSVIPTNTLHAPRNAVSAASNHAQHLKGALR
jgi:hypothetical protein